ncbi:MAG: hypothetical protein GXX92_12020 [Clostridiales bacterium]|nr:hypothetical protein [Clostridiales bacterium]
MTASWSVILNEIFTGSISTVLNVLKVLIPLMILIEFFHVYHVMEKLAKKLAPVTKVLGLSPPAILPLLVATVMGVTYGTGTLIEMNKRSPLPKKDFILIAVFFFTCHGIIETTAIWGTAGASMLVISVGRLLFAGVFTMVAARLPIFKGPEYAEEQQEE